MRTEHLNHAIVWAQMFIREAELELVGHSNTVPIVTAQLKTALSKIDVEEGNRELL